jgi:hypothetical protein
MGGGCIGTRGGHSVLWVVVVLGPGPPPPLYLLALSNLYHTAPHVAYWTSHTYELACYCEYRYCFLCANGSLNRLLDFLPSLLFVVKKTHAVFFKLLIT